MNYQFFRRPSYFVIEKRYPTKNEGEIDDRHVRLDINTSAKISDEHIAKIVEFIGKTVTPEKTEPEQTALIMVTECCKKELTANKSCPKCKEMFPNLIPAA